jgi:hypothetical protein
MRTLRTCLLFSVAIGLSWAAWKKSGTCFFTGIGQTARKWVRITSTSSKDSCEILAATMNYSKALLGIVCFLIFGHVSVICGEQLPQRAPGPFGMTTAPLDPVEVTPQIRALLPVGSVTYLFVQTHMAPDGEDIVVYYPAPKDESGSQTSGPEAAVIRRGKLEQKFAYQEIPDWGEVIAGYAIFALDRNRQAFALCTTNSGDGRSSSFLIFTWTSSGYRSVFQISETHRLSCEFTTEQTRRLHCGQRTAIPQVHPNRIDASGARNFIKSLRIDGRGMNL